MKNIVFSFSFLFFLGLGVSASDHKEAPLVDEQLPADIADLYVFLNPDDNSELVLAMTVNPFSVPAEARAFNPSPRVRYRFHIDNDGDASKDLSILVRIINFDTFEAVFPRRYQGSRLNHKTHGEHRTFCADHQHFRRWLDQGLCWSARRPLLF